MLALWISGCLVTLGTSASFNATTTNPDNTFSTGSIAIDTDQPGVSILSLSNMSPGDSVSALLQMRNSGSVDMTYSLTTTVTSSTKLDADPNRGLQLSVQRCSQPWSGAPATATCGGAQSGVVLPAPRVLQTNAPILPAGIILCSPDAAAAAARPRRTSATCTDSASQSSSNGKDYLKITVSLPAPGVVDNSFQNLSESVRFTWTGTQINGGPI